MFKIIHSLIDIFDITKSSISEKTIMKNFISKLVLFLSFIILSCTVMSQCTHTINMSDSYGDGWNNGTLTIVVDGTTTTTHTLASGYSGTSTFQASEGSDIDATMSGGSYAYERSWTIDDGNGTQIGSGSGTSSELNMVGGCSPPPPGDLCSNAINLASQTSPYSGSTAGFGNDYSTCSGQSNSPDMIFYYDVEDGGSISIGQTTNGYDSYHALFYGGTCPG